MVSKIHKSMTAATSGVVNDSYTATGLAETDGLGVSGIQCICKEREMHNNTEQG